MVPLLALLLPTAHAVPAREPGVETTVLSSSAHPAPVAALGTWAFEPDGLHLAERAPTGSLAYWLTETPVGDGFVRARFAVDGSMDATVLVRARVGDRPDNLEALGVSVEKDRLLIHRWREGVVVAMGPSVPLAGMSTRKSLELAIWLVGPQVVAVAYDGATLEALGTVTATDRTFTRGLLGVRIHPDRLEEVVATSLSVITTTLGAAPAPAADDPFGARRLVTWPPGTLVADRVLRRTLAGEWSLDSPEQVEAQRRRGVEPLAVTGHLPRWVEDPRYRAAMGRPYPELPGQGGYDLAASWKDWQLVQYIVVGLARKYPDLARAELVGRSSQGRPLWALRLGDRDDTGEPAVLFVGAHHGSELPSIDHPLELAQWLLLHRAEPEVAGWLAGLDIWVVPLANPDGNWTHLQLDREFGRRNGADTDGDGTFEPWEGVDLNRNYPFAWGSLGEKGSRSWRHDGMYRGPRAGSEAEVAAMMALSDRLHFAAGISFHTSATKLLSPYSIDGIPNPEPDVAWSLAEDLVAATLRQPNGRRYEVRRKLYSVDGTDQDWFFHDAGTLEYLIESSIDNSADAADWQQAMDATRPAATALLDDVSSGPWIGGTVHDAAGNPLRAEVVVDRPTLRAGEVWTSRASDGRFDRRVPGPGRYVVTARAPGFGAVSRTVDLAGERVAIDLVLARAGTP